MAEKLRGWVCPLNAEKGGSNSDTLSTLAGIDEQKIKQITFITLRGNNNEISAEFGAYTKKFYMERC